MSLLSTHCERFITAWFAVTYLNVIQGYVKYGDRITFIIGHWNSNFIFLNKTQEGSESGNWEEFPGQRRSTTATAR